MQKATTIFALLLLCAFPAQAQTSLTTEYIFSPTGSDIADPFAVGLQNGARGLSGPWDLDNDGNVEVLVAQHSGAGGRVHVIENTGVDSWSYVYSTAVIDSSASSTNARYAIGTDLDGDGRQEIAYVGGNSYNTDLSPDLIRGVYIWEHDGVAGSDNYGTRPSSIINFYEIDGLDLANAYAQKMTAADVDGDGMQELLLPANGPGTGDVFYVLSVTGTYETNGVGTGFETWNIEARINPREEANAFGGGSPNAIVPADLDGDGTLEISLHSWNNFVLFNAEVTGPDSYVFPGLTDDNRFINDFVPGEDHVALFGAVATDINDDGTDEVFYPNWFTKNIGVLDYPASANVLEITNDVFAFDAIEIGSAGGITVGDVDGDGFKELLVGGNGYSADDFNAGEPSQYIHLAEYRGGDPKDGANYGVEVFDTSSPADTAGFNIVYRDSLGTMTKFYETALAKQGVAPVSDNDPIFTTGIAYLGDADGDNKVEVAVSFQGVDDSLAVYDEVWNVTTETYDRTTREVVAAPVRSFMRIIEFPANVAVAAEDREGVPSGYALSPNFPNPFAASTTFRYTLPDAQRVRIKVYDVMGRLVKTIADDASVTGGTHRDTWDGTTDAGGTAASGTYFYTMEVDGHRIARPMILVK